MHVEVCLAVDLVPPLTYQLTITIFLPLLLQDSFCHPVELETFLNGYLICKEGDVQHREEEEVDSYDNQVDAEGAHLYDQPELDLAVTDITDRLWNGFVCIASA